MTTINVMGKVVDIADISDELECYRSIKMVYDNALQALNMRIAELTDIDYFDIAESGQAEEACMDYLAQQ